MQDLDGKEDSSQSASRAASHTLVHAPASSHTEQQRLSWREIPDKLADLAASAAKSAAAHRWRGRQTHNPLQHSSQKREQGWSAGGIPSEKSPQGGPGQAAATGYVAEFLSSIMNQKGALQPDPLQHLPGSSGQPRESGEALSASSSSESDTRDAEAAGDLEYGSGDNENTAQHLEAEASAALDNPSSHEVSSWGEADRSRSISGIRRPEAKSAGGSSAAERTPVVAASKLSRGSAARVSGRECGPGESAAALPDEPGKNGKKSVPSADAADMSSEEPDHVVPSPDEDGMLDRGSPAGTDGRGIEVSPASSSHYGAAAASAPPPCPPLPALMRQQKAGQLAALNKRELQGVCRQMGLPVGGLKHELVKRLVANEGLL